MLAFGTIASIAAGTGFVLIGIAALAKPEILSHLYGLYSHERNGRAFVRAAGVRDVAIGTLLIVFSFTAQPALFATLIAGACIAIADFILVWRTNGTFDPFLYAHLAGAAGFAAIATFVGIAALSR